MVYIPDDWIINKDNTELIHEILNRYFSTDIITDDLDHEKLAIQKLLDIGETIVIEKIKNGSLTFD